MMLSVSMSAGTGQFRADDDTRNPIHHNDNISNFTKQINDVITESVDPTQSLFLEELTNGYNNVSNGTTSPFDPSGSPAFFYELYVYGYIFPPITILTIVVNTLEMIVYSHPSMRSPTSYLLVAMALADMLTGLIPLPVFFFYYTFGGYRHYMSVSGCYIYQYLRNILPTIMHTASIWLNLALAIHRYIGVSHSKDIRGIYCTKRAVWTGILIIHVCATCVHLPRFFEVTFQPIKFPSKIGNNVLEEACIPVESDWYASVDFTYFNMYFITRAAVIQVLPCLLLGIFNCLLMKTVVMGNRARKGLLEDNAKLEARLSKESIRTTVMLQVILILFLISEVPVAVILIIKVIQMNTGILIIHPNAEAILAVMSNLIILLSYPMNFIVYCSMSRKFKKTMLKIFSQDCCDKKSVVWL
ncbi:unnamed protein product [Owenia fusiformis]|uniref:Uncharacterized protein n=1 Tax=Owenia fusiformis TaxID=6347 RepID=A0A8J1TDA1_OWEFU|nr:unnamed protein product [Owenia fusiformis]